MNTVYYVMIFANIFGLQNYDIQRLCFGKRNRLTQVFYWEFLVECKNLQFCKAKYCNIKTHNDFFVF